MSTTRSRLMASTLFASVAVLAAAPAMAQSTDQTVGGTKASTTETSGQKDPTTRVVDNAGGVNAASGGEVTSGEVVVTGSRISRRDYVSDSPIVSVGPKSVEDVGSITLDRLINQIPQFVPGLGSTNNNPGDGQSNVQLRGLGPTRTLVLVDGRRITPSNVSGVVDINTIPSALIENIEVVTGGQSTSYGTDAVAGVINFKLKHNFQGVVVDALYGRTEAGDGQQQGVSVTAGSNFDNDRGNAVLSLGYTNRSPIFYGQRADVSRSDFATINSAVIDPRIEAVSGLSGTKPQGTATFLANNLPTQAAVTGLFNGYGYNGTGGAGSANAAVLRTYSLGFNNDGTLFNGKANYRGPTSIDFSTIPGSVVQSNGGFYNTGALNYLQLPQTKYNAYSDVEYAITPHIKAYGQFMFTDYTSQTQLAPSPASGNPTGVAGLAGSGATGFLVPVNNPFVPTDLRTLLATRPLSAADAAKVAAGGGVITTGPNAPFVFNKRFSDIGPRQDSVEYTTYQSLVGIKGDVPGYDLTYDVYGAYGHLNQVDIQNGNVSHGNAAAAFANPTTAGGGACATYNPFGVSTIPAACRAYISPQTKSQTSYTQRIVEGDFQGKAFDTPTFQFLGGSFGGEVRFAAGLDYRSDEASFQPDALLSSIDSSTNSYSIGNQTFNLVNNDAGVVGFNGAAPVSGRIDVYETYGELLIPIVKDLPFLKAVNLDLGGRYSDYSTVGSLYTYKADLDWKVFDWLSLRGGYSRAIRAPNVSELFSPAVNGFYDIGAPSPTGLGQGDPCDVRGAARQGTGNINGVPINATAVRAECLAQGVPASVIDSFQSDNTQVQELGGGNPNLRQERTNTYTGGFVLAPKFDYPLFRHISASVDYYNIEINGVVGAITPDVQFQKCFNEDGTNPTYSNSNPLCALFVRDPSSGQVVSGFANAQNLGALRTSGIDFQVDWNFALSTIPYAHISDKFGALAFNLQGSWLNDYDSQTLPGDPFFNNRDSGNLPVWRAFLRADYTVGPFEVGVQEQYLGEARDPSCVGITDVCTARGLDPEFYTNFNARWKINDTLELYGTLENAFNQQARFFASASSSEGQTDAAQYGSSLVGRAFTIDLKARF